MIKGRGMIIDWVKKNKRLASKIIGANFLLMTLLLLFWSQPKEGMSENERAAANLARMEAQVSGTSQSKFSESPSFMKAYQQKQQSQLQVFLIIMSIAGVGFLGYGFFKKEED